MIVSDLIMKRLRNIDQCVDYLQKEQIEVVIYTGVASEPTDVYVQEALSLFKENDCDIIISLGGGSCIDTAKAIAVLATNAGYIGDYMGGAKPVEPPPIPHIAIPTTAGTGSEATDVTVITNTTNDEKMMIKHPAFMPTVAIVDPTLTMSSPKNVTAATGIDALCHAIEAYLSKKAQPMTDVPHGESNAMLLPAVLEFSKESRQERLATIGRAFSKSETHMNEDEFAEFAVQQIKNLCYELNIPNMKDLGIDHQTYIDSIERTATDAILSGSPNNNPRIPTKAEIEDLYQFIYDYQFAKRISYS